MGRHGLECDPTKIEDEVVAGSRLSEECTSIFGVCGIL